MLLNGVVNNVVFVTNHIYVLVATKSKLLSEFTSVKLRNRFT